MVDNGTDTVSGVKGEIGQVYAGPTTSLFIEDVADYDLVDSGVKEHTQGWLQVIGGKRIRVIRRRVSHSMCVWRPVQEDFPAGMAH